MNGRANMGSDVIASKTQVVTDAEIHRAKKTKCGRTAGIRPKLEPSLTSKLSLSKIRPTETAFVEGIRCVTWRSAGPAGAAPSDEHRNRAGQGKYGNSAVVQSKAKLNTHPTTALLPTAEIIKKAVH